MRCKISLSLLPLVLAGCISPFTSRLDEANERAAAIQQQLIAANAKLDEATRTLERSEAKLEEANRTFYHIDGKITNMDKRFATIELGFRKMFGIKEPQPE